MKIIGISLFALATNTVHLLVDRIGQEKTLILGSSLSVFGMAGLLFYATIVEQQKISFVWQFFAFVNLGLGVRGPGGFFLAMVASEGNDARATAIILLCVFMLAAGTTTLIAPFISMGLVPLTLACMALSFASLLVMVTLSKLPEEAGL